jgi:hypothetical protein
MVCAHSVRHWFARYADLVTGADYAHTPITSTGWSILSHRDPGAASLKCRSVLAGARNFIQAIAHDRDRHGSESGVKRPAEKN